MRKILIGLPLASTLSSEFFTSFMSAINLMPEEGSVDINYQKYQITAKARNRIVKGMLEADHTHLFFMDSDMKFPENALSRLLEHDKDIVGGVYTVKTPPFNTTIFKESEDEPWKSYKPTIDDNLIEVQGIGTGCLLIKRKVFEELDFPWFWYERPPNGDDDMMSEDIYFCMKAREKGFKIYADAKMFCGHIGQCMMTPEFVEENIKVRMDIV